MLIHFSRELAAQLQSELDTSDTVVQALQNLAQARIQGDHILTADNGVLPIVIAHPRLSQNTRSVFNKIQAEQAQIGAIRSKLLINIEIISFREGISVIDSGSNRVIQIPLIRFQRNDLIQPTFLIAENLLDCQFFLIYSSWFLRRYKLGKLPSRLKAVFSPGGGDTTERLLDHHSKEQRYLGLCITDSDQKKPNGSIGQTAKKCQALELEALCQHYTLPTRSVENLLCKTQIEIVLNVERERHVLLSNLARLHHLFDTEPWKHLHLKTGVRELRGPCQRGTEQEYWNSVAHSTDTLTAHNDGFLYPPISSKLLQWVLDHLKTNDPEELTIDNQLYAIWEQLALLLTSWTCASEPIRS
jgi:hypothetical protein